MRALSISEPYASYIRNGLKHFETRGHKTSYRGTFVIHASKSVMPTPSALESVTTEPFRGMAIAVAELTDCIQITEEFIRSLSNTEREAGFYSVGRYAWKLSNVRPIDPIAARGFPSFFEIDAAALELPN